MLEPDSGYIFPLPPEQELQNLGEIPIVGVEPNGENLSPLLEEPIDSPLVTSVDVDIVREESTVNENTDILTGVTEEDSNISSIQVRKTTKTDPGNNAKNALNLGKVGDKPIKNNDDIGFNSGGTKDKNDYYKFTLTGKENEVSVVVDGLKDDANLQLLDTNGKDVLSKSTQKGKKTETIDTELDKGTYYLRVYPQGSAKTKYGLSVSAEEILQDPDSKPSGATNLGPLGKKKKKVNDEIGFRQNGTRDNSDFYQFSLTEDFNNLNIVLDGLKDNANINLFDESQDIIDRSRAKGKSKEIIDEVLEPGTYFLEVEPQGSAKTKYQLSFDSNKIDDPDGNRNRAQEIKVGKKPEKIRDEVGFEVGGQRDQKDYYQFTLNKDSEVNLSLDGLKQNLDFQLLGDKGNLLYSSTNKSTDSGVIETILDKGEYYVLVKPVGSDRSEYTLSLVADSDIEDPDAKLPGNNLGKLKAEPITKRDKIGFKEKGFIDQSDFWGFELTQETDLDISLDRLTQNADLELYDEDGTTLIYSSKEKGKAKELISTILDKGTYYIKVKPNSGSRTNYELSLTGNTKIAEKDDALPGTPLGELGEKPVTKKDKVGFKPSGNVRDFADFYNFSLAEQSGVNITLDGLSGNATLSLLRTDGREIEVSDNKGSKDEAINEVLSAGNYYIGVKAEGNAKTKYDLGVTANVLKDDINSRKNAKELGNLNSQDQVTEKDRIGFSQGGLRDQVDYYSFNLTEASDVILTLDGLDQDANLLLLDENDQIAQSILKGIKAEKIEKKLKKGTYYAAIVPVGGAKTDYQLSLDAIQKTVDLSSLKFNVLDAQDGLKAGEKVKVNYQVNNIGNTKADTFNVGFYLSTDEGIDTGDFLLDTVEIKSLSGGQNTKKLAKQLTLPDGGDKFWQDAGDYYLGVIVDSDNAIAEDNELNNTSSQSVGVEISSDLKLSGFDVQQETVNPGQKFDAKVTVENIGGKINDFQIGYYLSLDNEITTSDTLIGSEEIASLGSNATTTISKQFTLPENSINGQKKYFVGAIADYQDAFVEVNETNNISQERVSLSPVPEDNAGDTFKKARNVGVVGDTTQKFSDWVGNFYGVSEDTSDYYQIEIDGRSNLNLTLDGLDINANLYLYNSEERLEEQSVNTENKKEEISRKLLPGTYYVEVRDNDTGNTTYNLEMSASPLEYPVPQIAGWNGDTALDIGAVGTTPIKKTEYVGNLHGFKDDLNDFYKFQVEGDSTIQIDLTGLIGNADLYLYDTESSGSIARSETLQKVDESIVKNLTPGTYFLEVQSVNDAKTTYDLQVVGTPLPNNGAGGNPDRALDLGTLTTPKTVNDWVGNIDDKDYYKFNVSENSTVEIELTGMSDDANLELFNNKKKSLASSSQTDNKDDGIITNLSPGDYFLEVDNYYGSVGTPYNLQLTTTSRTTDIAGNNFDAAFDLGALGTVNQTEWVGTFDDSDYYKFTIAGDSAVKLGLTGMNGNANITLYDNEKERITSSSNSGNADELIDRNLEPGDYFLKVDFSGSGADYNLTASATPIVDAGGNTKETAGDMGDISATKTFSNWVGNVDQSDWFKFTITGDSAVNLGLTGMTANGNLYLYDETKENSIASSTKSSDTDEVLAVNLNPGTYYVQVYGESGNTNYSLSATATAIPDAGGNTKETAGDMGDISATKTFSNWVGGIDNSDWFTFTIAGDSA
ncbi:MAG: pre-peptidase C-terminal domain-containing protein, partial [Okeania sp.]|nr:pre-peptidase C-terminal domain-containing protein [Okeania sp.]